MKITGPVASIIITLIITIGILFGLGSFNREIKNYATVNYEKGYKRIGIIYQERIFTEAILSINGDEITRGDFDTIRNVMNQEIEVSGGNIDTFNLGDGFSIFANVGIEWLASESDFRLTLKDFTKSSTIENPLKYQKLLEELDQLESFAIEEREIVSFESLEFSSPPASGFTFLMPKIIEFIQNFS